MPFTNPIYTIGLQRINLDRLMSVISRYGIDCVVDVRPSNAPTALSEFATDTLNRRLSVANIVYMQFNDSLGFIPYSILDKRGNVVYDLAIQSDAISAALLRLKNGIDKGYHILLIDESIDIVKTFRYKVIGRYFSELGYIVYHITRTGIILTQDEIASKQSDIAKRNQERFDQSSETGRIGENIATRYLIDNDYIILERNWNLHHGCELDIVALKDDMLHFVEVKTRSNNNFIPEEAIDSQKLRNIRRAAIKYCGMKHITNTPYQIDSIAIVLRSEDDFDLTHHENIGFFK